jgi:hypothetical protein
MARVATPFIEGDFRISWKGGKVLRTEALNLQNKIDLQSGRPLSDAVRSEFSGFENFLQEQLINVTRNLSKSGITETAKALRAAKTDWGSARIRGEYFGVRFAPEGKSEGREKSGTMIDSLSSGIRTGRSRDGLFVEGFYGWTDNAVAKNPYIFYQERGFWSVGVFDPAATAASGRAKFKESPNKKWIRGASSLPKSQQQVAKRASSAFSAAWNEAVRQYNGKGFSGSPTKPTGKYRQGR